MAWGIAAGGQLTTTSKVENFPGFPQGIDGWELMINMREQSIKMWTRIETKTIDKVDFSGKPLKIYSGDEIIEAKSIIIATWAIAKRLGIPWEKDYWQKGISACAVCDGGLPIFRGKQIIVIWWWDVAMEEAQHMTHFASKVIVLVRREQLRASEIMQARAKANEKIEFMRNTEALEALGNGDMLTWMKVMNNKTKKEEILPCSGLFYAIGHIPNTEFLWWQIQIDEDGYIITNHSTIYTATNIPWVFAAGDVADKKYRQAITSAGKGCMAALEAQRYLEENK